jgi:uncharacterized membrane protein YbaN (DUF454 family)
MMAAMTEPPRHDVPLAPPPLRALLFGAGLLSVALAAVGVFLPILPTTPFLLLAAWCFLRSSARMHRWILASPVFGPYVREWRERRTVPREAKLKAIALVVASFAVSVGLVVQQPVPRALLALLGVGLVVFLARLPSERPAEEPLLLPAEERSRDSQAGS